MVSELRDCVASPADFVCEWNWCRQISLIYIRVLIYSLFWTWTFLIGLLAWRRGSSNWDHEGSGVIEHPSRFQLLYVLLCFVFTQVFYEDQCQYFPRQHYNNQDEAESVNWDKNPLGTNWFQSPQGSKCICDFTTEFPKKVFHPPTCLGFF